MPVTDEEKWDRIYQNKTDNNNQVAKVLVENQHLLPGSGKALELACGLGANAIFLSKHNLETSAWDISGEAISRLEQTARQSGVILITEIRDVIKSPPVKNSFDVIVISRFLDRKIIPDVISALKDNGLVFYQTFIKDKVQDIGPSNPEYLLDNNELLCLFNTLEILVYREEGKAGDINQGFRNEAMLVARKIP